MLRTTLSIGFASWFVSCLAALPARLTAQRVGRPAVEPYTVRTYDGGRHELELWRLDVPESGARPAGRRITVAFLRLKSTSTSPGSPIVFLMGGPGIPASVMAPIPPYWDLFERLRQVSDVILLDQRGVGLSTPDLDCPPASAPQDSFLTSRAALVGAFRTVYSSCASLWRARGIDPTAYTDNASADDIDDVRRALGVRRVSLLAFSYGTRLALDFARRHLNRLDRMVLQGPEDPNLRYRSSLAADSLFGRYARLASADSASATFVSDLPGRLVALLSSADRAPIVVRIRAPSGDSVSLPVGKSGLQAIIGEHVGDPRLPALIATLERGDTRILAQYVTALYAELAGGGGSLMGRAIECAALPSPTRIAEVDSASMHSVFGPLLDDAVVTPQFCAAVGLAGSQRSSGEQLAFAGPALIIQGTLDDRTGGNAAIIARSLPRSVTLLVQNGGHELLPVPEVGDVVLKFFEGRSVAGLQLRVVPPRFLSIAAALQPASRRGS